MGRAIPYERIFELEGIKVVDTSFLDLYLLRSSDSTKNALYSSIEAQLDEYERLERFFLQHDVSFPDETSQEFYRGNVRFSRLSKELGKSRQEDSRVISEKIWDLVERRRKLMKTFRAHSTERFIPGNAWETSFLPAILYIASIPGIKRDHSHKYGNCPNQEHKENDERIFAKSLGLACHYPVFILTRDIDFIRMQKYFYSRLNSLLRKYSFKMPKCEVGIVYHHIIGGDFELTNANGDRKFF